MEKCIFDKNNGLWYELQGDYYIPRLVLDKTDILSIEMWGRRHLSYLKDLKEHRPILYTSMALSGRLHSHLAEVDNQATEMLDRLVKQMAELEGITEQVKTQDQMAWVGAMNSIRNRAEEIVNAEVIFA